MQRHRVLLAFGIAWLSALLLSWWVYKTSTAAPSRDLVYVVAASQDLPVGRRIQAGDLKLIALDRKDQPKGAFLKTSDIVDRAVAVPMAASELVLSGKLAGKGSGEGLTALIEPGTRAISVQVNEISGVSGFIQPGTRVDVLFTRVFSNGDAATTTLLQNVKVIAYGRQLDPGAKVDPRDTSRPTVATLLVTQEQGEKLVLAGQRGRIQLALRNGLDDEVTKSSDPVQAVDLGIDEPRKPASKSVAPVVPIVPRAAPVVVTKTSKPENEGHVVRIYRAEKVTEETLK
ncbi:MAG TPA: Flp pilus assembly protein CpaB [Terriglobales bacterium]|jgi:pilus assembly protein CpaB|nr:Flp pilus assembly protein CpaB [Terriglobales bacterium]